MKRKVIFVTDGDYIAQQAVEIAAQNIGGRCISKSGGNPTEMTGKEISELIKRAHHDPVVVMVDDHGTIGRGKGENALKEILDDPDIEVLGIIAVASNTEGEHGVHVDASITNDGKVVEHSVDKHGVEKDSKELIGDTVGVINDMHIPVIIGIGDPGKMYFRDSIESGAPITTMALKEVMKRNGLPIH